MHLSDSGEQSKLLLHVLYMVLILKIFEMYLSIRGGLDYKGPVMEMTFLSLPSHSLLFHLCTFLQIHDSVQLV